MLYMINPRTRRRGASGRFTTTPRTRKTKRKTGGMTMAKRRRKAATKGRKRRRTVNRRRRVTRSPAVQVKRRGRVVYNSNPRRRRRRTHYARNPRIIAQVKQLTMDTIMVTAGGAVQRVAAKFLPTMSNPLVEAAKGTAVAVAVGIAGRRFLGADRARFLAAGAMMPVLKNVVTAYLPSASAFMGDYEPLGTYSPIPAEMGDPYPDGGYLGNVDPGMDTGESLGSYQMGTY